MENHPFLYRFHRPLFYYGTDPFSLCLGVTPIADVIIRANDFSLLPISLERSSNRRLGGMIFSADPGYSEGRLGLARVSKRCPHRLSILTKVLPDPLFLDLGRGEGSLRPTSQLTNSDFSASNETLSPGHKNLTRSSHARSTRRVKNGKIGWAAVLKGADECLFISRLFIRANHFTVQCLPLVGLGFGAAPSVHLPYLAAGTSAVLAPTDTTIHYREPAPLIGSGIIEYAFAVRYERTWANPWVWVVWRKQWESPNIMLVVGLEAAKESASVEVMSEIRMS
ncbi:hypothetical protein VNO77_50190 [Canavalia gladiata]|uniref:Uncharacterized protein n=1 Tax=Canavalia gladiata TaxID=3824 RepID=A0AAN9PET9_CANGL